MYYFICFFAELLKTPVDCTQLLRIAASIAQRIDTEPA
jgi:hypothetical protein